MKHKIEADLDQVLLNILELLVKHEIWELGSHENLKISR